MWYGHAPFSENAQLLQNMHLYSNVNRPGRFIFRVDEWIQPAGCSNHEFGEELMDDSKLITELIESTRLYLVPTEVGVIPGFILRLMKIDQDNGI